MPQHSQTTEVAVAKPIKRTKEEKTAILNQLSACQVTCQTYGRQAEDLAAALGIILEDFGTEPTERIVEAIRSCRKSVKHFPTCADIEAVLNPKPTLDRSVYISCCKRRDNGEALHEDYEYIRKYERAMMRGDI